MTFIKWGGSKINLIPQLKELFPDINSIEGYIENFLGGGSVFFYLIENYYSRLSSKPIFLSDINPELINTYRTLRDNPQELISMLEKHQKLNEEKYFYDIRKIYPPGLGLSNIEKSSMFIYLLNSSFGGTWRVNSEGKFNKAYNNQMGNSFYNEKELYRCSKLLQGININVMSFENTPKINKGNLKDFFTYSDPPYMNVKTDGSKNYDQYTPDGFHLSKKMLLKPTFKKFDELGCKIMMSNSSKFALEQEFKEFNVIRLKTERRNIALDKVTKHKVENAEKLEEMVIMNYESIKKQKDIMEAWL